MGIVDKSSPYYWLKCVSSLALAAEVIQVDQKVEILCCQEDSVIEYFHDFNPLSDVVRVRGI